MHFLSTLCRYFLCLIPYLILVSNKDIIYHITGPITIPPFHKNTRWLISFIAIMEFVRIFYEFIGFKVIRVLFAKFSSNGRYSLFRKMSIKYGIVIILKLFLIFSQTHRMKYYLHVFFLELFIMGLNILADIINNPKVSTAMDIIAIDGLNRVAIFYEITRTFNPNFGLYFFGSNLLSLICYQLQGKRNQILYVKHDVYRLMVVTLGYSCLFCLLQCSLSFRPLIIFILTFYFFFEAIKEVSAMPIQPQSKIIINMERGDDVEQLDRYFHQLQQFKKNSRLQFPINRGPLNEMKKQRFYNGLKNYFIDTVKNKPFLNFILLIGVTILIELLFIYNSEQTDISSSMTLNSFSSFLLNKYSQYI